MHMRAALETLTWTWLQLVVFGMSFVYYFGFLLIYSCVALFPAAGCARSRSFFSSRISKSGCVSVVRRDCAVILLF